MLPLSLSKLRKAKCDDEPVIVEYEVESESNTNRKSRKVLAIGDGHRREMEFDSITIAARHFGISPGAVANSINRQHRAANRRFCFAKDIALYRPMENLPRGLSKYKKKVREPSKLQKLRRAAEKVIEKMAGPAVELEDAIEAMKKVMP